jgi:hypothetical protein
VVMRVTVLKAAPGGVGAIVEYLAGPGRAPAGASAAVDYYDDPGEPPGRWWGSGCAAVGLAGEVDPDDLARMLDAAHPGTGRQLGRGYSACSARGFDATFSAPKSVSLLWALTGDEAVRAEVLAAHDTAVEAALGWLETHGCVTRRGTDGVDQVDAGGLCVALFRQHTSRALDPQLHTHGRDARRPPSLPRDHRGRSRCLRVRLGLRGPPHLQRVAPAARSQEAYDGDPGAGDARRQELAATRRSPGRCAGASWSESGRMVRDWLAPSAGASQPPGRARKSPHTGQDDQLGWIPWPRDGRRALPP